MARRNGTIFFGGDDRFIELMHALTYPEEQWAQPERPDIILALDELTGWANDGRAYDERVHKSGWMSAIADFLNAADALGSVLTQHAKSKIDALRSLIQRDVGGDLNLRTQLRTETATLRVTLAANAALSAAWQDLLRACGRKESSIDTIAARRDTFWAIARGGDRNVVELSRNLTSVLSGSPLGAYSTMLHISPDAKQNMTASEMREAPPTSPKERLNMVDMLLTATPRTRYHIVWFAFRNAYLDTPVLQQSPFQFFDASWIRGNLENNGPHMDQIPREFRKNVKPSSIPDERDVVMARVDLGPGAFSDAVRIAGEQLDTLIDMSSIGRSSPWERMSGFIHIQDESGISERFFEYSESQSKSPGALESTAAQISKMAPRVAPLVPVRDPAMRDIIASLHWWRVGTDHASAASIVLDVRVIELLASRTGEPSWTTYLEKYTKNLWIRDTVLKSFSRPLYEALTYRTFLEPNARQHQLFLDCVKHRNGEQHFDISKAASNIDEIMEFVADSLPLSRDLRTIRRKMDSSSAMNTWCKALENQWQGWIHRLERARNSISHGGPFTEQLVSLTQPFSRKLSAWMLWECIDCYLDGKTVTQAHLDIKLQADGWRKSMADLTSAEDIFKF